ncbi:MAG TPA: Fur family transcriptional regulator [Anaerolineales bacterium]|nr:Fur family transcriptional regulator [Anaerolineales bacterium]
MTCGSEFAPHLRSRGFRVTTQRLAVLHVLRHSTKRLSPGQVWQQACLSLPGLTETTVYRTLDFLVENGLAWRIPLDKGHLVYEIAGPRHHHLICRNCGDEMQVDHSLVSRMYAKLEAASGYQLSGDHMTLFGLCPECQKSKRLKGVT